MLNSFGHLFRFTSLPFSAAPLSSPASQPSNSSNSAAKKFLTPLVPWVPLLGVALNSYILVQRPLAGWVRLGVVSVLTVLAYVGWGGRQEAQGGEGKREPLLKDTGFY